MDKVSCRICDRAYAEGLQFRIVDVQTLSRLDLVESIARQHALAVDSLEFLLCDPCYQQYARAAELRRGAFYLSKAVLLALSATLLMYLVLGAVCLYLNLGRVFSVAAVLLVLPIGIWLLRRLDRREFGRMVAPMALKLGVDERLDILRVSSKKADRARLPL